MRPSWAARCLSPVTSYSSTNGQWCTQAAISERGGQPSKLWVEGVSLDQNTGGDGYALFGLQRSGLLAKMPSRLASEAGKEMAVALALLSGALPFLCD